MESPITAGSPSAALIHGHVGKSEATRVGVIWNGGDAKMRLARGYFIGVVATIRNPVFRRLPFTVVAYDARGHVIERRRIPTSLLYTDWKRVEPLLHRYRRAHGCSMDPSRLWVCRTR
jgi:hypothetical protein